MSDLCPVCGGYCGWYVIKGADGKDKVVCPAEDSLFDNYGSDD